MADKFVEVTIAGRALKLSPFERKNTRPIFETFGKFVLAEGGPLNKEWFQNLNDALGFMFLAVRASHPDLTLNEFVELAKSATLEELGQAFDAWGKFTAEYYGLQKPAENG